MFSVQRPQPGDIEAYRTALYRYTVDGSAPTAFAGADLGNAYAPKKQRRGGLGSGMN